MNEKYFSLPTISEYSKGKLLKLAADKELEKESFETLRAVVLAALTTISVMEDAQEFCSILVSLKNKVVLGHISKVTRLSMGILELPTINKNFKFMIQKLSKVGQLN